MTSLFEAQIGASHYRRKSDTLYRWALVFASMRMPWVALAIGGRADKYAAISVDFSTLADLLQGPYGTATVRADFGFIGAEHAVTAPVE